MSFIRVRCPRCKGDGSVPGVEVRYRHRCRKCRGLSLVR